MNLKKSDKMIAIVGVVILIIAAVGIVLYTASEEPDEDEGPTEEAFMVTWSEYSGQLACIEGYAGKSASYTDPIAVSVPSGSVLTSISVQIVWDDDNTYRGILSKGEDTLTAEIAPSGGEYQTYQDTGSGNETLYFTAYDRPYDETLDAEDYEEAQQLVYDMVQGKNDASYDVLVTVNTGEKLRRPLQYLKDKGNAFNLFVSYTYYSPTIEQEMSEDMDDENNDDDDMQETSLADLIKTIGHGRDIV